MIAAALVAATTMAVVAQSAPRELHVCHAGSLLAAFTEVEQVFMKQHPDVKIVDTSGGSVDLVRRFAAGSLPCDVIAPADYLVIDTLLKPVKLADFTIRFASGRMVLAYVATDPKGAALPVSGTLAPPSSIPSVAAGWEKALTAPGVRISGAHPFMDPGGYRAHMVFELAQNALKAPGLYNALLQHYQVNVADPTSTASAPALGRDFTFQVTYEHSAAAAAKTNTSYRYARLPESIDLSGVASGLYAGSSVTIPGSGIPGSRPTVVIPASRVEWGLTIPSNSSHRPDAIAFVSALLGASGQSALTTNGPAPLMPARVKHGDRNRVPTALRSLVNTD